MKPVSAKLENLLGQKLELLRRMEAALGEEIARLSEDTPDNLSSEINLNDEIISAIKNIDYEISRIEASEGRDAASIGDRAGTLISAIDDLARRNESRLVELIEKLNDLKHKTRAKERAAVQCGRISGYKPGGNGKAVLFDRRK